MTIVFAWLSHHKGREMGQDVEGSLANIGNDPCSPSGGGWVGLGIRRTGFQVWLYVYLGKSPGFVDLPCSRCERGRENAGLPQGGRRTMRPRGQRHACPKAGGQRGLICRGDERGRAAVSGDTLCHARASAEGAPGTPMSHLPKTLPLPSTPGPWSQAAWLQL